MKSKKKRSSLKFSPLFRPKLGEEQKKKSLLKFTPIFCPKLHAKQKIKKRSSLKFPPILSLNVGASLKETHKTYPLCDQTLCPTCKGAGPCLNFAYYSMQLYNSGDPKGGGMAQWPPLTTPLDKRLI